jgi:hypothetical protein
MPSVGETSRARAWRADGAFVASLQRQLPRDAMVFELPVVDFPEHSSVGRMSAHDLIKQGYLHSTTLRWSTGGVRGRDGEWQWPASFLPMPELVRGVTAMGFSAVMLDRYGFRHNGDEQMRDLRALLGDPIATRGDRLMAWDLRSHRASLLRGMSAGAQRALAQQLFDAPQLYMSSDADPLTNRGEKLDICAAGSISIVNPGAHGVREHLEITFKRLDSSAHDGQLVIRGRPVPISFRRHPNVIPIDVPAGVTTIKISVVTPGVRCKSVPDTSLPSIAAVLRPVRAAP